MIDKPNKPPIQVDLGAKAEARLEVKAEVPSTSVGRLVDALTDMFRPFSEARGLRADQIRLQREDVLIEIAKKAQERIAVERGEINPVPNKFLIPFMEKASLEDPTSELCEAWANLLVEASKKFDPKLGLYVDVLSKISGADAKFLKDVCWTSKYEDGVSWPLGHFRDNERLTRSNLHMLDQSNRDFEDGNREDRMDWAPMRAFWNEFKKSTKLEYGYLIHGVVIGRGGCLYFYNDDFGQIDGLTVDRLEGERLLRKNLIMFDDPVTKGEGSVSYVELTYLAIDLVRVCTRNFSS